MIDYLPQIRLLHISCAIASGALFLVRGLPVLLGLPPFDRRSLRRLSYGIDTVLLGAAIVLMVLLRAWPGTQHWVAVKLSLVVAYIVLGSLALKRGRTRAIRRAAFLSAVVVYLAIIAVARSHDPLGPLHALGVG